MARCLTAVLVLAACAPPPTAIDLELACEPAATFSTVTVQLRAPALDAGQVFSGDAGVALPSRLRIVLADEGGEVQVSVDAEGPGGARSAQGAVTVVAHSTVSLRLDLSGGGTGASCRDGELDGDETAIDCGGACGACVGQACGAPEQCATGACAPQGICTYASGPPGWRSGAPLTPARYAVAGVGAPSGVYAIGGLLDATTPVDSVSRYDALSNAWSSVTPLPAPTSGTAAAFVGGRLWAAGGKPGTTAVVSWAPGDPSWASAAQLPHEHAFAGGAGAQDTLYVVGGLEGAGLSRQVEVLRPDGGWSMGRSMPTGRSAFALAATASEESLYAVGGSDGAAALNVVEQYVVLGNQWASAKPMPTARGELAAVFAPDGRLWAMGGSASGSPLDAVEAWFPPPVDTWVTLPFLPGQRAAHAAAVAPDGRLVVFGGRGNAGELVSRVDVYGPVATVSGGSVRGENFAARATVTVTNAATGAVLVRGTTDASGVLAPVPLPALPSGTRLRLIDHRSRYPVTTVVP
ncbi:MAG: hypothetical protein IPJ65_26720 [Archangiaceae bacterium]|nr:hypothetical protein [Archangiaceae bacterium]